MVISTAAGAGAKKAAALCSDVLFNWGIPKIYTYGINVNAFDWEHTPSKKKTQIQRKTGFLAKEISKNKTVRPGIKLRLMFSLYRGMQKANWGTSPEEKEYWKKQGWLENARPWKN